MKNFEDMSWTEKAAALMVAVGKDTASEILKHLDEESVYKISIEMAKITDLSPEDREDLMGEFIIEMKNIKYSAFGGEEVAKKILMESVGIEKAKSIFKKINTKPVESHFDFLKDVESDVIYNLLKEEHPQTISVTLVNISRRKAADILSKFDKSLAKDIALRIAKMGELMPEAIAGMALALKKKYDKIAAEDYITDKAGGIDRLAEILNHTDGKTESEIMKSFEMEIPDKAAQIRDKIYTFESAANLTNKEIRIVIDEINDDHLIALSLKGAGDDIRFKFLRNVSNNRATDILEEMDVMGAVRMSDILDARREIVNIMRELNDNGSIILRKNEDRIVE